MENKYAVIVAGGTGSRMNAATPKQFLLIHNRPIIWYSVISFLDAYTDLKVILVLPKAYMVSCNDIFSEEEMKRITVVEGGSTRFQSVRNGLTAIVGDGVIFVHDGARCLVSTTLIKRCYEQALSKGSAVPYVLATDSIRKLNNDTHSVEDRNNIAIIQTPQTFISTVIQPAYQSAVDNEFTDEASVVEAFGQPVSLIEGEYENIKITRPIDLIIADHLLKQKLTNHTAA